MLVVVCELTTVIAPAPVSGLLIAHIQSVVPVGKVSTPLDAMPPVPILTLKAAVPLAVETVGDVPKPLATVGAVAVFIMIFPVAPFVTAPVALTVAALSVPAAVIVGAVMVPVLLNVPVMATPALVIPITFVGIMAPTAVVLKLIPVGQLVAENVPAATMSMLAA